MSSPQSAASAPREAAIRTRLPAMLSVVALVLIMAAAAYFRIYKIDAKSFWTDEGVSAAFTRLHWYDLGRILWRREANMTLYYLLLRGWTLAGDSVAWIRGLSALFSLATVPVVYVLGRKLFGGAVGFTAALLLAVNAYAVRYAQEARSYSLVMLLVTLATWLFVRATESGRRRDWTSYVVASVLAIYAHFFAVLVVVAQWVAVQLCETHICQNRADVGRQEADVGRQGTDVGRQRPHLYNWAVKRIALWTLPVWAFIASTGAGPIKWIRRPSIEELGTAFSQFAGNGGAALASLYAAGCVLALIAAVRACRTPATTAERGCKERQSYILLLAWLVVPVAIALLVSLVRPVFLPRYLIVCLPALVLLVAAGFASFRERWMAAPVLALTLWFAIVGLRSYYREDFDLTREDFRGVAQYVAAHAQPGDIILFHNGQGRFAYEYYANRLPGVKPTIVFPGRGAEVAWGDFMGSPKPDVLQTPAAEGRRIWMVFSQNGGAEDKTARELRAAAGGRERLLDEREFSWVHVDLFAP
ncbi:MAG: glycosyltransferase family 39 protein [Terriglobales bacterium]